MNLGIIGLIHIELIDNSALGSVRFSSISIEIEKGNPQFEIQDDL
jgi:hypothetical protein